jgi:hypothetical protein
MNRKMWSPVLVAVCAAAFLSASVMMVGCAKEEPPSRVPTTTKAPAPGPSEAAVNVRCPISGDAVDPQKTPPELTRMYKGQKVAFCCPACPPAWEKLADAEKDAKLAAAKQPLPAAGTAPTHMH